MFIKKFAAILAVCVIAAPTMAQQKVEKAATTSPSKEVVKTVKESIQKVMLNKDGGLEGKALVEKSKEVASNTKVTLSAEGKVIDEVKTDENGNFSFASVAPGPYQILGSSDGFVGSQSFDVVPFSTPAVGSPCSIGMCNASSDVVYDNFASQPVSSFSSTCGSCNTCGGGLGGGSVGGRLGGGLLGGRFGGGLLSNGRIGLVGLAGLAGLSGIDSSPDQ